MLQTINNIKSAASLFNNRLQSLKTFFGSTEQQGLGLNTYKVFYGYRD